MIGLGALQFFLRKASRPDRIDQSDRKAFRSQPREEIFPVMPSGLHCDQAIAGISEERVKPPVPGGFLSYRFGFVQNATCLVDYSNCVPF